MGAIRFKPVYQTYLWGGSRLRERFDRLDAPALAAESWELSDRVEGMSVDSQGKTLAEWVRERGEEILGKGRSGRFPLLIKLIDAKEHLSVQIHPDERAASKLGSEPKSEAWVALEPSGVWAGVKGSKIPSRFPQDLESQMLHPGEALYVPGGAVHAISAGSLLLEVQQNSNTTYRIHDWGRGRELHLEEAHFSFRAHPPLKKAANALGLLIDSPHFRVERFVVLSQLQMKTLESSFQIFFCEKGSGVLQCDGKFEAMRPGMTLLIPASARALSIEGSLSILRITA